MEQIESLERPTSKSSTRTSSGSRQQTVCMVSDFFYPNMGGVEIHIFKLSQCLLERGHKVLVITHHYDDRVGVKYITNFLKVYYLPIQPFYNKSILPTIVGSLPYLRKIFLKEKVTIVHGHSAFSSLAHEALFIASILGIPSVFTDHSLFGFSDASAIVTNAFLKYSLANTSHIICVSHTGKDNTVLRSQVQADRVSVIPNAVCSVQFRPEEKRIRKSGSPRTVTIVVGSRLVYRKGIDLLAQILPVLCSETLELEVETDPAHQHYFNTEGDGMKVVSVNIEFIIAGDGPKRILLEEVVEKYNLQHRVKMIGELQHSDIRDKLLIKGDIFLNTSLTEAFCIAIVEAVSCGLTVVSTNVGGIPEVLPSKFIFMVEPNVEAILQGIQAAVKGVVTGRRPSGEECNKFVKEAYNWSDVARRTEIVYTKVTLPDTPTLDNKVRNLWECGWMAGPVMAMIYLFCHYWCIFLAWCQPIS